MSREIGDQLIQLRGFLLQPESFRLLRQHPRDHLFRAQVPSRASSGMSCCSPNTGTLNIMTRKGKMKSKARMDTVRQAKAKIEI